MSDTIHESGPVSTPRTISVYTVQSAVRRILAAITRRLPAFRGLGRFVLAADRILTNENDPVSYETVATVNGTGRLVLDLRNREQKFVFYYGTYEPEHLAAMERLINGGGVIYDIGASIGLYSVPMALACRKNGGHVRAFEPVPQNLHRLDAQLVENGLGDDLIQIERVALSNEPGTATMNLCDSGKPGNAKITGAGQVRVEVSTLDAIWAERGCEHIEFIKIDTEGWDAKILEGGRKCVSRCRPGLLIEFNRERMTNHGIPLMPAWMFLVGELNYRVFRLSESGVPLEVHEPGEWENLFFVQEHNVVRLQQQ